VDLSVFDCDDEKIDVVTSPDIARIEEEIEQLNGKDKAYLILDDSEGDGFMVLGNQNGVLVQLLKSGKARNLRNIFAQNGSDLVQVSTNEEMQFRREIVVDKSTAKIVVASNGKTVPPGLEWI
jgi:hypothetical protein